MTRTVKTGEPMAGNCQRCGMRTDPGAICRHRSETLCDDCCMEMRITRGRKTHWQYLRSIKTEYLRPAPAESNGGSSKHRVKSRFHGKPRPGKADRFQAEPDGDQDNK